MIQLTRYKKAITSDWGWSAGGLFTMTVAGLLANGLIARELDRDDVGAFFVCASVVIVASLVGRLGLDYAVVRDVSAKIARSAHSSALSTIRVMVRACVYSSAVTAGLTIACLAILAVTDRVRMGASEGPIALFLAGTIFVESLRQVVSESFRGLGSVRMATVLGAPLRSALLLGGVLALRLLQVELSLIRALAVACGASAVTCVVALCALQARTSRAGFVGAVPARASIARSAPIMLSALVGVVVTQGAVLVSGVVTSSSDTAIFGAALRVSLLLEAPLFIANSVLLPRVARLWAQGDLVRLQVLLRRSATVTAVPALLALVVLLVAGGPVLDVIYGSGFGAGALCLSILAAGQLVNCLAGSCGVALNMSGHQGITMKIAAVTGGISIVGQFALGATIGVSGIAFASAAGQSAGNICEVVAVRRRLKVLTVADPASALGWIRRGRRSGSAV